MYRPESSIIDNKTLKLFEEINKILKEQKSIDIASAYFNIAGFQLIKNSLTDTNKFRLLIGTTPETEDKKPDIFQPEVEYKKNFRKDLEDEPFERDKRETVESLIEFLKGDNAKVRLYDKGFLHGKAYIFDKLAIIGSSNFTYSGFTSNTELNAVLDEVYASYIKKEWFEKFWSESRDFKDEFLKIFDESKFGTKEYLPFDVFIKALYELQKEDINFEFSSIISTTGLPSSEVDLTNFQEDAVKRIYSRLKTYNGVLVADSVGLGKTWIAKKVIEDFGFYQRRKFLVICPASVDELLWRPALKDIGVSENIIHQEELGREDFSFESLEKELNLKLKDIALIVVDESHNFRNSNTNRFENLFTLIEKASELSKPKILLLTATPMNNSYWDFYFQLMLITQYNKSIFSKEGIFDLEKLFKKADRGNTKPLNDILQIISIRRTRQYIKDNYPDAEYKDKEGNLVKIKFPNRELFEINYSLNETYQGFYYKIAEKIEKELKLAYYRLEEYRTVGEIDKMALGRMKALAGILQIILLKRLESSIEAFRKSIQHQIDFLNTFKEFFNKGKVLKKKFYDKYIAYLEEEIDGEFQSSEELNKDLESINLFEFDKDKFLAHLDSDIETFGSIKKLIESIDEESDAKLRELKNKLIDLKDIGNFTNLSEIKKANLRIVKNTKTGDYWLIENEFLKPVIKSPRECKSIMIKLEDLKYKVFMCHKSREELKETYAFKYIEWGENADILIKRGLKSGRRIKGYQNLETIKNRKIWYNLGVWGRCSNILPMFERERKYCFYFDKEIFIDAALYYVYANHNEEHLNIILNSTLFGLFKEILSRPPEGGGGGPIQMKVYHYMEMPITDIKLLTHYSNKIEKIFPKFIKRNIKSIFEELGIDPSKSIRSQKPNPLPDRKALDDIIFDILGLTQEERNEVYWAVCELVKNRLEKAKSV